MGLRAAHRLQGEAVKALLDPQVIPSEAATDVALAEACRQVKDVGSHLQGPALLLAHVAARLELLAAGKWPPVDGSAQPERVPASDHLQAPLALVEVGHCKLQAVQEGCQSAVVALTACSRSWLSWLLEELCGFQGSD